MPKLTPKGKRSFTYSTIIVFILVVFALGYLFYFIPHNKATLQKNGFIILRTISANFDSAVAGRINLFSNFVHSSDSTKQSRKHTQPDTNTIKRLLYENGVHGSVQVLTSKDPAAKAFDITDNSLTIEIDQGNRVFRFREPIDSFFEALVSSQKNELFSGYTLQILRKDSTTLVYHDKQLAVLNRLAGDTISSPRNGAYVAGITNFSSENSDFKMFYYPFSVRGSPFVISGFVDSGQYNYILRQVPFYFIFPLVVVFLLVLIGLPVIKFYVMDSNERMGVSDVFFFGGSAVLGATLLALMIIQFLLWKGEEIRIGQNLSKISSQITTSFLEELSSATKEIVVLDSFRRANPGKDSDISERVQRYVKNTKDVSSHYLQFDRVSWIDSSGWQRDKAELYKRPVYTRVDSREYFKIFKTGIPYRLPGHEETAFGWEPIYSNTNGDLNISISLELQDTVVAMATKMYSVMQTIVPAGYGFCIVDADGNVQIHSESDRSLRENFLEKTDKPNEIRSFMLSRQSKFINNVSLYNKQCAVRVQPLARTMPFYLVTFCDKAQIISVNMRILIFSVLLSLLFFTVVGIVWLVYGPKRVNAHPLVYCKMDLLDWATPKRKLATYYLHSFIYVLVYSGSVIGFAVSNYYKVSNVDMIALVLLTPYNILVTLFCIRSAVDKSKTPWEAILQALIHLAVSLFIFYLRGPTFPLDRGFLLFQVLVNLILWIYCAMNVKGGTFEDNRKIFFWKYKSLIWSLVVCFSVLPAGIFTWYAHNQEITQNMKRQQLYLAKSIKDRSSIIENSNQRTANLLNAGYLETLEFSRGIYRLFGDNINHDHSKEGRQRGTQFEDFYSSLMEKLAVTSYDKNSFPALPDTTHDYSWSWWIHDDALQFFWPSEQVRRDAAKDLSITSVIPPRFVFLTKERILPVVIVTLLLFVGLFSWMSGNSETIFLTNFIYRFHKNGIEKDKKQEGDKNLSDGLNSLRDYKKFNLQCTRAELVEYEQKLISGMEERKGSHLGVWLSLSDKEKFLVYSFARDGIVNYKNVVEITNLLDRGILAVDDDAERLRISNPEFRAYVLSVVANQEIKELQVTHRSDSTWRSVRVPLLILLLGIAALVFFTQHGIFEQLLLLAGGATTLINFMTNFFSGAGRKAAA